MSTSNTCLFACLFTCLCACLHALSYTCPYACLCTCHLSSTRDPAMSPTHIVCACARARTHTHVRTYFYAHLYAHVCHYFRYHYFRYPEHVIISGTPTMSVFQVPRTRHCFRHTLFEHVIISGTPTMCLHSSRTRCICSR